MKRWKYITGILTVLIPLVALGTYYGQDLGPNDSPSFAGLTVSGLEGLAGTINIWADDGDDTADKIALSMSAAGVFSIQPGADSTTGIQILDANGGTPILNVDTTNERVGIGTATPEAKLGIIGANATESNPPPINLALRSTYNTGSSRHGIGFYVNTESPLNAAIVSPPNNLAFYTTSNYMTTEATERMRIDSSGNVGIGTTTPGYPLEVSGGGLPPQWKLKVASVYNDKAVKIGINSSGLAGIQAVGNSTDVPNILTLNAAGGNVGIGTAIPLNQFSLVGTSYPYLTNTCYSDTEGNWPLFQLQKSDGTEGSPGLVDDNAVLGELSASGHDGTDFNTVGAKIRFMIDGTPAANRMPTEMMFYTASGLADNDVTQRMVIDKNGNVGIGITAPGYPLHVYSAPANTTIHNEYSQFNPTATANGTYYNIGLRSGVSPQVSAGVTNSGYAIAGHDSNLTGSGFVGTLTQQYGRWIQYGTYNSTTGTVSSAYGLKIDPYNTAGTITTRYSLYLTALIGGGTCTNQWALYSGDTADSYFAGDIGIGDTTPDANLEVVDDFMVSSAAANDGDNFKVLSTGEVRKSRNPAFLAYNSAADNNVTGDLTEATVDFDTEVFDQGSDFASDTFTAPVTGRYHLNATVLIDGFGGDVYEGITLRIATSNRSYYVALPPQAFGGTSRSAFLSVLADMDAADTAYVTVIVLTGTKTIDILGGATYTFFSGWLAN